MEIKCLTCDKLLLDDIKNNMVIGYSSDFIKQYDSKEYPEIVLEIKCRKCKNFFTLIGRRKHGKDSSFRSNSLEKR
jgi:phage FluMu protein Com